METKYYLMIDGERRGPFTRGQLIDAGMQRDTLVWFKGAPDWLPAEDVASLSEVVDELPPTTAAPAARGPSVQLGAQAVSPTTIRRLFWIGSAFYVPALLMLIAAGLLTAFLGMHGFDRGTQVYDPQVKRIVYRHDPTARDLQQISLLACFAGYFFGPIGILVGSILYLVLLHRAWSVVQDGQARTTPGAAVGLLFVPFFNLYWIFVSLWGLTRDLNSYIRRYDLDAPDAGRGTGFTLGFYYVLGIIPGVGFVTAALNLMLFPFFARSIAQTAATLASEENQARVSSSKPLSLPPESSDLGLRDLVFMFALVLAPVSLGCFVVGMLGVLNDLRGHSFSAGRAEAAKAGIADLRARPDLNDNDRFNLRMMENDARFVDARGPQMAWSMQKWGMAWAGGTLGLLLSAALGTLLRLFPAPRNSSAAPERPRRSVKQREE